MSENTGVLDQCNVFVKYLPSDVTDSVLYTMFADFGKIISAKVMIDHQTGTSLGYGFVRFYSPEDAKASIEQMSEKKIGNKTLLCKLSNYSCNPSTANLLPHANLYIKPLSENFTEAELLDLFGVFGNIEECKVMIDKNTGTSRQIGFVRYTTVEHATHAMTEMNGKKLTPDGPPLVVRYAETLEQKLERKQRNQHQAQVILFKFTFKIIIYFL